MAFARDERQAQVVGERHGALATARAACHVRDGARAACRRDEPRRFVTRSRPAASCGRAGEFAQYTTARAAPARALAARVRPLLARRCVCAALCEPCTMDGSVVATLAGMGLGLVFCTATCIICRIWRRTGTTRKCSTRSTRRSAPSRVRRAAALPPPPPPPPLPPPPLRRCSAATSSARRRRPERAARLLRRTLSRNYNDEELQLDRGDKRAPDARVVHGDDGRRRRRRRRRRCRPRSRTSTNLWRSWRRRRAAAVQ